MSSGQKDIEVSVGSGVPDDFGAAWDKLQKHLEVQAEINQQNPRYQFHPDGFDRVCQKALLSDSWTLDEAAHLIAGYVPDRPHMPPGDKGSYRISEVKKLLKASDNVAFRAVQNPLFGRKRFPAKKILEWAHDKGFPLAEPLLLYIVPAVKTVKPKPKRKRADTELREKAQAVALRYFEKVKARTGKRATRHQVAMYVCKEVEGLSWGLDEERVKRWVKDVDPDREELRKKYGNKG